MVRKQLRIKNISGLHLRPTGMLCNEAIKYQSSIQIVTGSTTANAKSVLSILGACVKCGDEIELICEGADEKEALETITELINGGLGE